MAPRPLPLAAPPLEDDDDEDISGEALLALIAHREREVERCKLKFLQYKSLLDSAEIKLAKAQERIDRYLGRKQSIVEKKAPSPAAPAQQPARKPRLVVPGANTRPAQRPAQPLEPMHGLKKATAVSPSSSLAPPERSMTEEKPKGKIEGESGPDSKSSAKVLSVPGVCLVPSQHMRKLRCIEICPVNDQLIATSALDGSVFLWQVQPKGLSIYFRGKTDVSTPKHRRPEDIAWHRDGETIFSVYTADGEGSQVSMTNLISGQAYADRGSCFWLEAKEQ